MSPHVNWLACLWLTKGRLQQSRLSINDRGLLTPMKDRQRALSPLKVRTLSPLKARTLSPLKARTLSPLKARTLGPLKARTLVL